MDIIQALFILSVFLIIACIAKADIKKGHSITCGIPISEIPKPPPLPKPKYSDIYEYSTLEKAYECVCEELGYSPYDVEKGEEWLMNIHNHLVWKSFIPEIDPIADLVVHKAIDIVSKECEETKRTICKMLFK